MEDSAKRKYIIGLEINGKEMILSSKQFMEIDSIEVLELIFDSVIELSNQINEKIIIVNVNLVEDR